MIETSTYSQNGVQRKQMHYSPNLLSVIDNGIHNNKVLVIEHESYEKGVTIREVEPMAVVYKDRRRALVAWCRLRNDFRSFRLDRINCVKVKQEDFIRRPDFNVNNFQDDPSQTYQEDYEGQN